MTVSAIREKLITYMEDVDDKKVKALYTLLQDEIELSESFTLTKEQLLILDEEHNLHLGGKTKSYSRDDAREIVRGNKTM
jgi:hypothetical protein